MASAPPSFSHRIDLSVEGDERILDGPPHWLNPPPDRHEPQDEFFFHATTFANVRRIFRAREMRPELGTGQNGNGFYVCPTKSDYQKVMALRNRGEGDRRDLFILTILVRGFYNMKAFFCDGFAGRVEGLPNFDADFVATRWDKETTSPVADKKTPMGRTVRYDQYQGQDLDTLGFGKRPPGDPRLGEIEGVTWRNKIPIMDQLWEFARLNRFGPQDTTGNTTLDTIIRKHGVRPTFLRTIEELTFKQKAGPALFIVGAHRFLDMAMSDYYFEQDRREPLGFLEHLIDAAERRESGRVSRMDELLGST